MRPSSSNEAPTTTEEAHVATEPTRAEPVRENASHEEHQPAPFPPATNASRTVVEQAPKELVAKKPVRSKKVDPAPSLPAQEAHPHIIVSKDHE
jgi:hypothetical protein